MFGRDSHAVPTLLQLLQPETASIRKVLVDSLAQIEGREASVALARRAVYDLAPEVRASAVRALQSRPVAEFKKELIDNLRYPWPPVSLRAAEAIAFLDIKNAADAIEKIAAEADPRLPSAPPGEKPNRDGGSSSAKWCGSTIFAIVCCAIARRST